MPRRRNISNTILETTGDERVVDDVTAEQMSRQVENDQREYAAFAMFPGGKEAPLWDCLEKSWTKPLPKERIYDCYLPKRVIKCSACRYTTATSWTNGTNIQAHVDQVIQRTNEHQDGHRDSSWGTDANQSMFWVWVFLPASTGNQTSERNQRNGYDPHKSRGSRGKPVCAGAFGAGDSPSGGDNRA